MELRVAGIGKLIMVAYMRRNYQSQKLESLKTSGTYTKWFVLHYANINFEAIFTGVTAKFSHLSELEPF